MSGYYAKTSPCSSDIGLVQNPVHNLPNLHERPQQYHFDGEQHEGAAQAQTYRPTTPPDPSYAPGLLHVLRQWVWELLSVLVAAASLIAMYETLKRYDGTALPELPRGITLNTVVSLLSQLFTVCIGVVITEIIGQAKWNWFNAQPQRLIDFKIFDDAKSSPLGAAKLLTTPRFLLGSLAAGTSLVMIITLAVGPFTQQLLRYESTAVATTDIATVPLARQYFTGSGETTVPEDKRLTAALFKGMFEQSAPSFDVPTSCATGNCTWSPFASIGVCSQCVNRTLDLVRTCADSGLSCNYTLPSGGSLSSNTDGIFFTSSLATKPVPGLQGYNSTFSTFDFIGNSGGNAVSCAMYVCVKTYQASEYLGKLTEHVTATFPNASTTNVASKVVGQILYGMQANGANVTLVPGAEDGIPGGGDLEYGVGGPNCYTVGTWLRRMILGQGKQLRVDVYVPDTSDGIPEILEAMAGTFRESSNTTLDTIFARLAQSLTNAMRTYVSSFPLPAISIPANGTVFTTETHANVQWAWIALPVTVLVLTVLLLVLLVAQTFASKAACFKSGSLPVLFAGLTDERRLLAGIAAPTTKEMEKVSGKMQVMLQVRKRADGTSEFCLT